MFDIFCIKTQKHLSADVRMPIVVALGLKHVPVLHVKTTLKAIGLNTLEDVIAYADGKSLNPLVDREGVVFKSLVRDFSFKSISRKWLAKNE